MIRARHSRTLRDLHLERVAHARLRGRLAVTDPATAGFEVTQALADYRLRTGELPTATAELAAEVRLLAGPLPEGWQPLPDIGTNGPTEPEFAWSLFHAARPTTPTPEVLGARLALAVLGFLPEAACCAEAGTVVVLDPSGFQGDA